MDIRLEKITLHNSLHGCLAGRGMGTGIIEAKLAQQLAHLEQTLFFGIFIFWDTAMNVCRAKGNYGRPFISRPAVE